MSKKQKVISSLVALFLGLSTVVIPITNVEIKEIKASGLGIMSVDGSLPKMIMEAQRMKIGI